MKLLMHTRLECHAQKQVMETQEEETASPVAFYSYCVQDQSLIVTVGSYIQAHRYQAFVAMRPVARSTEPIG